MVEREGSGEATASSSAAPPEHRAREGCGVAARFGVLAGAPLIVSASLLVSGCGASPHSSASAAAVTAQSYANAKALLTAMAANGAPCSGVSYTSSSVYGGVGQFVECSGASNGDTALGIFDNHSDAVTYADDMVSVGKVANSPVAVVVGPDWAVNTSPAFAKKVVKAIGGTIITGSSAQASAGADSGTPVAGAPTAAGLSSGDQQFVSDMQSAFNFGSAVQDSDIAAFGEQLCTDRESGTSIASEVPTAEKDWTNTSPGDAIQMIVLAEKDICPAEQTAQTVTYEVTGSSADVTYGPSGSDNQGTVPMSVTQPLGSPQYYAINAQLQGGGSVNCKIKVDGVTISSASASGGYNIADCEVDQNVTTGSWENTNNS